MLRGEKVVLRAWEREDIRAMDAFVRDPRSIELMIMANGFWEPMPAEAYSQEFDEYLKAAEKSQFVIEVQGRPIGFVGLHSNNDRRSGTASLGINILDPQSIGKGYGRDAINVLLDWAFRVQNYRRVWLEVFASNERAVRAYRACGFVEEGRLREHRYVAGRYDDMLCMGILRSEWEARVSQAGERREEGDTPRLTA